MGMNEGTLKQMGVTKKSGVSGKSWFDNDYEGKGMVDVSMPLDTLQRIPIFYLSILLKTYAKRSEGKFGLVIDYEVWAPAFERKTTACKSRRPRIPLVVLIFSHCEPIAFQNASVGEQRTSRLSQHMSRDLCLHGIDVKQLCKYESLWSRLSLPPQRTGHRCPSFIHN